MALIKNYKLSGGASAPKLIHTNTGARITQQWTCTKAGQLIIAAVSCGNGNPITSVSVTGNAVVLNDGSQYQIGGASIAVILLKSVGDTVTIVQRADGNAINGTMYVIDISNYNYNNATLTDESSIDIPSNSIMLYWSSAVIKSINIATGTIVVAETRDMSDTTSYPMNLNVIASDNDAITPTLNATPTHKLLVSF